MASVSTSANNYFVPQQLAGITSSNIIESAATISDSTPNTNEIDAASFLGQLTQHHVPVFEPEDVPRLKNFRDLGRGGSFTAIAGTLSNDFETVELQQRENAPPEFVPVTYKAGQVFVARHLNFNSVKDDTGSERGRLLAPLATEILILSDERVKRHNHVAALIGVGWESSPYDEDENPRHWPFLLTAFGSRGTLTDLLRDMHRRSAPAEAIGLYRPAEMVLQKPVTVKQDSSLDWSPKIGLAAQIASGLEFLHSVGVVHGDVKFENIVFGPKVGRHVNNAGAEDKDDDNALGVAQLCDFGSSFLLAGAEDGNSMCSLRSYSFPWGAPEVHSPIPAKDLPRTDIYSFGLVFARLILDGNDPFDPAYHVASGRPPSYDTVKVRQLKELDQVADTIIDRIKSSNICPNLNMLHFVETIIRQTSDKLLRIWLTPRGMPEEADMGSEDFSMAVNRKTFIQMDYSGDGWMPSTRIPDLQSPLYTFKRGSHSAMREVFLDLSKQCVPIDLFQADPSVSSTVTAAAALQTSLCHLHGWGTPRSATNGMMWLKNSALQGCQAAQRLLLPLSKALDHEVEAHAREVVIRALRLVYKEANDRLVSWTLREYDRTAYLALEKENRTTHIDAPHRSSRYPYQRLLHAPVQLHPMSTLFQLCSKQNVNRDLGSGMTYLHCASAAGDVEIVRALTSKLHAAVNARMEDGRTPLLLASCNGHADVVMELLRCGADPNIRGTDKVAPFHFLTRFPPAGMMSVAKALLDKGALLNALTVGNLHPLETTVQTECNFDCQGEVTALKTMMELGADPIVSRNEAGQDDGGINSLAFAMMVGDADAVSTMLDFLSEAPTPKKSSNPFKRLSQRFKASKVLSQMDIDMFCAKVYHETIRSQLPIQRLIGAVVYGAETWHNVFGLVLTKTARGRSYVAQAQTSAFKSAVTCRAFDLVDILTEKPVMFNVSETDLSAIVATAFCARDIGLVRRLFTIGLTLDYSQPGTKSNLLHLAARHSWTVEDVKSLFEGAQELLHRLVNELNTEFENPFDVALLSDRLHMAEYYRNLGAEYDTQHHILATPMSTLSYSLLFKCILLGEEGPVKLRRTRYLLQLDPSFVVCDAMNTTALTCCWKSWADQRQKYFNPEVEDPFSNDLVELLLEHFPDPRYVNAQNHLGVTAMHFAARMGNIRAIETLLTYGADINAMDGGGDTPLDTVGDKFCSLMSEIKSQAMIDEGQVLVTTQIETYWYNEVGEVLVRNGAKSGNSLTADDIRTQLFGRDDIPEEELEKIRAAEQRYADRVQADMNQEQSAYMEPGTQLQFIINPPEHRKDVGSTFFTLQNRQDEPLIRKHDAAHGKGKQPEESGAEEHRGGYNVAV